MAAPRGRGRPPKLNAQAEQLSEALAFVSVAYVKDDTLECAPYVKLGNKMATVFSRQMSAGHPIEEDLNLSPHLDKLKAALARCGKSLTIAQTPSGALSVSGDKLRAVVPCWAEPIPMHEASPSVAVIDERITQAFKVCNNLASETGERVVEASLLLEANTCTSTNGFALLQFWHGIDLPPHMVLPKLFTAAVCKIDKPVIGLGFEWDNALDKVGSVTIWFDGGAWISCQCYSDSWPDLSHIIDVASHPLPIPAGFFEAVEAVKHFSDDSTPSVMFAENKLMSHTTAEKGGQYEVIGLQAGKRFNADILTKLAPYMLTADFTTYKDKAFFFGGEPHALIRGACMGMVGGVEPEQPQSVPEASETGWDGAYTQELTEQWSAEQEIASLSAEEPVETPDPNVGWNS
jgi:hypothetical protein